MTTITARLARALRHAATQLEQAAASAELPGASVGDVTKAALATMQATASELWALGREHSAQIGN